MILSPSEAKAAILRFRTVSIPEEINKALDEFLKKWVQVAVAQTSGAYNLARRQEHGSPRTYTKKNKSIPGWFPYHDPLIINIETGELVRKWDQNKNVTITANGDISGRLSLLNYSPKAMRIIKGETQSGETDTFLARPFDQVLEKKGRELLLAELLIAKRKIIDRWGRQ